MKTKLLPLVAAVLSVSAFSSAALAEDHAHHNHDISDSSAKVEKATQMIAKGVMATHARALSTIPGIKVSSGYVNLMNHTNEPIKIVGVESNITEHTEIHRMFMRDSKMAMRKVESFEIKPHETFELTPGGFHVMFMMLQERMEEGQTVDVTFLTESGDKLHVKMPVVAKK